MKNKKLIFQAVLFWLWQLTWGALITIPGLIIAGICILLGGKVHRNGYSFIIEIGKNWGGVSLGEGQFHFVKTVVQSVLNFLII